MYNLRYEYIDEDSYSVNFDVYLNTMHMYTLCQSRMYMPSHLAEIHQTHLKKERRIRKLEKIKDMKVHDCT